ncbi:MAG: SH3 domain-containing protein [Anaerolineae bacterium]|nr:SH3 domain-containing protein [Thermoflexales bacterium]MDW8406966.1 SH3 domain-containing protein [Anaerolineae bacterium]
MKNSASTPRQRGTQSRAHTLAGIALAGVGLLVLISLVALPFQYLLSISASPGTPTQAVAQSAQRPTRIPRTPTSQAVSASQAERAGATEQQPSASATPAEPPVPTPTYSPTPAPTSTPSPTPMPTRTPSPTPSPTPTPTPTPVPIVRVTPLTGTAAVNLRFGPGLGYAVVGVLRQGDLITVTGVTQDRAWWRVDLSGKAAWVSGRVVRAEGDAAVVPLVPASEIPRLPPSKLQPTATPSG